MEILFRSGLRKALDNKQVSRTRAQATRNQLQEANSSCGCRKKFLRGIIFGLYCNLAVDTKTNHLSSSQEISCIRNTVIIMCIYILMCKHQSDRQLRLMKTSFTIQNFTVSICSQTFIKGSLFICHVVNYLHLQSDFPKIIVFIGT